MSNEDYEWWVQYIENYTADEQEIMELAEELEIDIYDIKERIGNEMNCDMEDEHAIKQRVLQEIKEEHGIIYNQGRKRSL